MAGGRKRPRARRKPGGQLRVAVCIDTRDAPGRERLLGCYQYALDKNWRLHLFRHDNENEIAQLATIDLDGAVIFDRSRRLQETLKARGVVCVETGGRDIDLSDAAIFVDENAMARMVVGHLGSVGFERFGYCGIADSHPSSVRAAHFLEEAGAASRVFEDQWRDGEMGISPLMRWLDALPKPAGVMVYNDIMGERVLAACRWANIRVPDEVGVIGLGNDELICEVTLPRLSSVALPARWIGRAAAETLEWLLAGKKVKERWRRVAPLEVVSRASTDRLPKMRPVVLKAVEFMKAEGHRPIGTDQVAAAVGVPRRTLDWAFSADMGRTVHDYFVELRMQNAKRLLRQTDIPLVEVSHRIGYGSLSAFMRMFAARTGKPPREYREQHRYQRGG
jgi:LacI family transcriptional regulator